MKEVIITFSKDGLVLTVTQKMDLYTIISYRNISIEYTEQ
jgi:hypothetical protein